MTASTKHAGAEGADVISILTDDHKMVKKLFKNFYKMKDSGSDDELEAIVGEICNELTVHADAEEAIFYPAARTADEDLVDKAEVEHATARDLISQLQSMSPSDPKYNARVAVLNEYIDHHVEEEESKIFPKAKKAKLDLVSLGEEVMDFKQAAGISPVAQRERGKESKGSGAPRH